MASVSDNMKPASMQSTTESLHGILRGHREQRDGTVMLGTWENPPGAHGVNRVQPPPARSNKGRRRRGEVGEAHSSDEAGESRWSEGALAPDKPTQKQRELIGR